jgi:hypothetical protein
MAAPTTFGSYSERLLGSYSGDWIAHLILTTCSAAVINFWQVLAEIFARYERLQPRSADGFEITACFGPPPALYPRFIVMAALLIATLAACKRIATRRFISAVCLATALGVYVCWWIDSYRIFRNFEDLQTRFLVNVAFIQSACLYGGTFLDLAVVLLISVCLVIVLDRLFDGEKVGK